MIAAIAIASALLLVGLLARATLKPVQTLFVPASVMGGLIGLGLVQGAVQIDAVTPAISALADRWRDWPGVLIAVVFAGLLLEPRDEKPARVARGVGNAAIMVWIIALGQIALGLVVWFALAKSTGAPAVVGQLIEGAFIGGHGTSAALAEIARDELDFPDFLDLGLFMATVGLVYSVFSGIVFVNIGVRRGWTRASTAKVTRTTGLEPRRNPEPIGFGRTSGSVLDPLTLQIVFMACALGLGALMQSGFALLVAPLGGFASYLGNVPLFLFTLLGGGIVKLSLGALGLEDLIDGATIRRLVAVAMEFLIVAAIASLRIETITSYAGVLTAMCVAGFVWTAICLFVLAPRLLPRDYWFELGILNYGMSTGTTAQGMMLLRIVDRDLETPAAEVYALAAPLSAPFIGGGIITVTLPVLMTQISPMLVVGAAVAGVSVLVVVGRILRG